MSNKFIELPLGYRRLFSGPLDTSMVMTSIQRADYLNDGTRYAGQLVYDTTEGKLYTLNAARSEWVAVGSNVTNTAADTAIGTLRTELTALSFQLYADQQENLRTLLENELSSLDSIGELASTLSSLSATVTTNNTTAGQTYLTKENPTITGGVLKLNSGINYIDNSTFVDSYGVYFDSGKNYYIKTTGEANVAALTASSLELGSGNITTTGSINSGDITSSGTIKGTTLSAAEGLTAGANNFQVSNVGAITNVAGITSQGVIDAGSNTIKTTGTVEAGTLSASGSVYGKDLTLTDGITASSGNSFKVDAQGNVTANSLAIGTTNYKIESTGDATLKDLTVSSINNTGALSAASGNFRVDQQGNVVVGVIGSSEANLTVTGNLSVLGTTTYLDTEVKTLSTIVAELNSDSATTLAVKQTGSYAIATFAQGNDIKLTIANNGSLSAVAPATFDSTVNVGGKLTVSSDISSTQTVYGSAGVFSNSLEVGSGDSVLYVDPAGVGIDTETLGGYSLNIAAGGTGQGTMYVGGSANFAAQANIVNADSTISNLGVITNGGRIVNVNTLWQFISALDGGSF